MVDFPMKNKEWNKCTYLFKELKQRSKRQHVYLMAFLYKEIEKCEKKMVVGGTPTHLQQ